MAKAREVAVWLDDGAARLIVGAGPAKEPSRWAAQGVILEEIGVGFWLKADTIQAGTSTCERYFSRISEQRGLPDPALI
jgi:hypothetical protein